MFISTRIVGPETKRVGGLGRPGACMHVFGLRMAKAPTVNETRQDKTHRGPGNDNNSGGRTMALDTVPTSMARPGTVPLAGRQEFCRRRRRWG